MITSNQEAAEELLVVAKMLTSNLQDSLNELDDNVMKLDRKNLLDNIYGPTGRKIAWSLQTYDLVEDAHMIHVEVKESPRGFDVDWDINDEDGEELKKGKFKASGLGYMAKLIVRIAYGHRDDVKKNPEKYRRDTSNDQW